MIGRHARVRKFERVESPRLAGCDRGLNLGGADCEPLGDKIDAVEAQREFRKRRVAADAHVVDDGCDRGVDIGR